MNDRRLKGFLIAQCIGLVVVAGGVDSAIACPSNQPKTLSMGQNGRVQASMNQEQTTSNVRLDSSAGIYLVSDRSENLVEFFQRHRVVVGSITLQDLGEAIAKPDQSQATYFVAYPSFNDDGSGDRKTYGSSFKLAPISPEVIRLWQENHTADGSAVQIFLVRDTQDSTLYHFVGWTENERFSFSPELAKNNPLPASLKPEDLWYQGR